jgi:hypothetical protein
LSLASDKCLTTGSPDMIRSAIALSLLGSVFLAGCAGSDTTDGANATDDCFYIRNVNSWDEIDAKHAYIKEGVSDHYLVTLANNCRGLDYANAIALSNYNGRMCPNDFGAITFRDGGMRMTCRINNVEAVSSKDEAIALAESRSK